MNPALTGVILAGGASRRMGEDKALLDWGGEPLISRITARLRTLCARIVIVAADGAAYRAFADECVPDALPGCGVLGGIHAGLEAAAGDAIAVVGCDMPFAHAGVLRRLADSLALPGSAGSPEIPREPAIAAALRAGDHLEPLHAVYGAACLPEIERALRSGEHRAQSVLSRLRVRWFEASEIQDLDPGFQCIRNLNTPADLADARREAGLASAPAFPGAVTSPVSSNPPGPDGSS